MVSVALRREDLPHYTYDDYVQWQGNWELVNGIAYAMVPAPAIKHQEISNKIAWQLYDQLKECKKCKVLMPVDWQITEDTIVQPDNLVVCGENIEGEKLTIPPVLIFEILSPTTLRKDRVLKYQLYENAGVKYYCIVDPDNRCVEVYLLGEQKYKDLGEFVDGKMTFDLGPCVIEFDFARIF